MPEVSEASGRMRTSGRTSAGRPRRPRHHAAAVALRPVGVEDDLASVIYAIAAGDTAALATLYDATVGRVYALIFAILGCPAAAEEVTCEVYASVVPTAHHFDATRGLAMAWLLFRARGRALDRARLRGPRPQAWWGSEAVVRASAATGADRQEDVLALFEPGSAVRGGLAALPPERRRLLALSFFAGLSAGEIAEMTGLSADEVISTVREDVRRLTGLIEACDGP